MPRLERYRRFVAILPRNIFEGPKFIHRNWKWALTGLHERRSFQQTFAREVRWVKSQKSVWETEESTLHVFESHWELKPKYAPVYMGPVKQAGSFNRASSVLCSCEKFQEIVYVIVCTKVVICLAAVLNVLNPLDPDPPITIGAAKDNSDLTCARRKDLLKNARMSAIRFS